MIRRACLLALATVACGRSPSFIPVPLEVGDEGTSGELVDDSASTGEPNCFDTPEICVAELLLRRAVDILFVVDNSGSMGGEQGALARSFGTFVEVLEDQQVGVNYRIAVTTTDGTGTIRATSCRSRIQEFIHDGIFGYNDERQRGCLDHCAIDQLPLPDPWVEKSDGETNLPAGVSMEQALQCMGPQGISGPGFEAPLESMRLALLDEQHQFLRNDALLAVIFVTDEADCSMSEDNLVWITNWGEVFWTKEDGASSASCWVAGVECVGGPGVYEDCYAVDKGRNGLPGASPEDAVLYPLSRYVSTLTEIAATKQAQGGQSEVLVAMLNGVPLDYPETGNLLYADSFDPEFTLEYGIGPGCGLGTETLDDPPGIPPVRLRQFAEAFATENRNMFSICADDYGIALDEIAGAIGGLATRACVAGCVSDRRYDIPGLQPRCDLVETFADDVPDRLVQPCIPAEGGWAFPSDDVHVCYRGLIDPGEQTPESFDDMSAQCVTLESNLEIVIERREGIPVPAGTAVRVRCQLDGPVGVTCDAL